jgi:hypothetical protein
MIVSGSGYTAFGVYDSDTQFCSDADKVYKYVMTKLGDPVMTVELTTGSVVLSFEEATLEYSAIINSYQAKSVMTTLLGSPTGSLSGQQNRYPQRLMEFQRRMAQPYNAAAGLNSNTPMFTGSITTQIGQQTYDLQALVNPTGSDGLSRRINPQKVYHYSPLSAYRFFGTTSAVNYLHSQFNFESFTPETIFYLLPIWEDVIRGQQFKMSNNVRRSNYSFEIHNNVLTLYPAPSDSRQIWFTYYLNQDPFPTDGVDNEIDGVSNLSNVPFGNIEYSKLNSISRQWVWKMTYALSKELLGHIRGKMQSIPIPNGDLTLDGNELITEGRQEQDQLRQDLKGILEETTYDKLLEREAQMAEQLQKAQTMVPLKIYVGSFLVPFLVQMIEKLNG